MGFMGVSVTLARLLPRSLTTTIPVPPNQAQRQWDNLHVCVWGREDAGRGEA